MNVLNLLEPNTTGRPELLYSAVAGLCCVCKAEIEDIPPAVKGDNQISILVCSDLCQALLPKFPTSDH